MLDDVTPVFSERTKIKDKIMSDPNNGYYPVDIILDTGLAGAPALYLDLGSTPRPAR